MYREEPIEEDLESTRAVSVARYFWRGVTDHTTAANSQRARPMKSLRTCNRLANMQIDAVWCAGGLLWRGRLSRRFARDEAMRSRSARHMHYSAISCSLLSGAAEVEPIFVIDVSHGIVVRQIFQEQINSRLCPDLSVRAETVSWIGPLAT